MKINSNKFEIAYMCLERKIEDTKYDIDRVMSKKTNSRGEPYQVIMAYKDLQYQLEDKLQSLELTYYNFKEAIEKEIS